MPKANSKLAIYLDGGQTINLVVEDWKLTVGSSSGELRTFSYTTVGAQIAHLDLSKVTAIIDEGKA